MKTSNMKDYQFEEITAALSVIIALLAYQNEFIILTWIFGIKSCLDFYATLKYSIISVIKERKEQNEK